MNGGEFGIIRFTNNRLANERLANCRLFDCGQKVRIEYEVLWQRRGIDRNCGDRAACRTPERPVPAALYDTVGRAAGRPIVTATTRFPNSSCATRKRNVESTPDENATAALPISRNDARRRSSFASGAGAAFGFVIALFFRLCFLCPVRHAVNFLAFAT